MTEVVDFAAHTGLSPALERCTLAARAPILAAVDLGEESRAALLWAGELAERTAVPLEVLHVIHDPAGAPGRYAAYKLDPLEPMADTAGRMLSNFMACACSAEPGLKSLATATVRLASGLPAQSIVQEAVRIGAGLIVLGCRGKSGLAKLLHGSNIERVTRLSPIPVTVFKAPSA